MDVVGSEIGLKMRSAIKAKLTELGCYVDDELPDYVMVMVANKRTRVQMEDDLQLFLGNNTELFVNWLHQVLKKLQEVTVSAPVLKIAERDKSKERLDSSVRSDSKDRKSKEKKLKQKKSDVKKAKKKDKEKQSRKKDEKKIHKSKKKSKHHEIIRPNIPPLLMNMEKESEPSITDVFAGQILKNHGISLDHPKEDVLPEIKPVIKDIKRPILPIIDPATISSQLVPEENKTQTSSSDPKEDQIKEINQIEAKIQGLKQKLADQLDSISDDEDFLNIRTEAEELMNDFAEDVFQEISDEIPVVATPPLKPPAAILPSPLPVDIPSAPTKDIPESLPQIELKLPKRPMRERLGAREESRKLSEKERKESPERFTPEREPEVRNQKSAKSRLGGISDTTRKYSTADECNSVNPPEIISKAKLTSKVSLLDNRRSRSTCASVVRVRPRPRGAAPASSLLLRAVADAHKSLLNTPNTETDIESQQVKRALVLPMRRCVDAQKIVIEVPTDNTQEATDSISLEGDVESDDDKSTRLDSITDKEEYIPTSITKRIVNNEYIPSRCNEIRTSTRKDDTLIIETINIHNTASTDKKTQFIVTMDGYHPNAFLAKKLQTEGLLADDEEIIKVSKEKPPETNQPKITQPINKIEQSKDKEISPEKIPETKTEIILENKKRLSSNSEESAVQVIIEKDEKDVKNKNIELKEETLQVKKRRASPIVFDVNKRAKTSGQIETEHVQERTESVNSDGHVIVTTVTNTHKYDTVPPLSLAERKPTWCRAFPACRYGASCAFAHPRCKFLAACTRRNCAYSHVGHAGQVGHAGHAGHEPQPALASHVVPAANYKSVSPVIPNMCKFYPNCVNPSCHFYHPKPCRYGNSCANKLECNFYHSDVPPKWRYPV